MHYRTQYIKTKTQYIKQNFQEVNINILEIEGITPFIIQHKEYIEIQKLLFLKKTIIRQTNNPVFKQYESAFFKILRNLILLEPMFEDYRNYLKSPIKYKDILDKWMSELDSEIYSLIETSKFIRQIDNIESQYLIELSTMRERAIE